jgi:hypothetical protein
MRFPRVTRKRFHLFRVALWTVQIPVAVATPLKASVVYLVFLSLAALIESAGTDYDQARQDERRQKCPGGD